MQFLEHTEPEQEEAPFVLDDTLIGAIERHLPKALRKKAVWAIESAHTIALNPTAAPAVWRDVQVKTRGLSEQLSGDPRFRSLAAELGHLYPSIDSLDIQAPQDILSYLGNIRRIVLALND